MLIIIINESLMAALILPFLMLSAFLLIKVGINFQHLCARIAISFVFVFATRLWLRDFEQHVRT
jgi:hypothetical protein